MYKYKNEEILNPPAYQPTKNEIQLAKARYVLEYTMWEMMHTMTQYYEMSRGEELRYPYTKENVERDAKHSIEKWNKAMDKWNDENDIIDAFVDDNWFKDFYVSGLSVMHCGDCTAVACSCQRCHAEALFGIPNTATWKGKHDGYRLLSEFEADFDKKKKEDEYQKKLNRNKLK